MQSLPNERQGVLPAINLVKAREWVALQPQLIMQHWAPVFATMSMTTQQSFQLWSHWFKALGDAYKTTQITREAFVAEMDEMAADLARRTSDHRYFMGQQEDRTISWDEAIATVVKTTPGEIEVDMDQEVAFCRISFPDTQSGGESKMRYVFDCSNKPSVEPDIIVTGTVHLHNRLGHLFQPKTA